MADQVPPETTEESTFEESSARPASGPGNAELPDRIRVHALAKLLGVTSRQIMGQLSSIGQGVRSPHSSLDRSTAEAVRDSLAGVSAPDGAQSAPAAAAESAPASAATTPEVAAASAAPEAATAAVSADAAVAVTAEVSPAPTASAPAQAEAAVEASAPEPTTQAPEPFRPQTLFTSAFREEVLVEPLFPTPDVVTAPLFLQPDATAVEEARRRRRPEPEPEPVDKADPEDEPDDTDDSTDDEKGEGGQPRRRRRGRRGRGRGRGEQSSDESSDESDAEDAEDDAADDQAEDSEAGDAGDDGDGASRRRRRRRRRKVGGDGTAESSDDDPPNTVVHEREPRNKRASDEVQGISGSTRLEAKRQRRRDGRDAGRRRPPILTESEFLARREAVDRVMVVREKAFAEHPMTTQVAVLEDKVLVEHFVTTSAAGSSMVGNVYLGKVQNVLPSMEAAFVDIGRGRNGVLYAGEVDWDAAGLGGRERKIEQALKPGDQVLVQVSKDPVGHKGARLTTQISLAGRFLVYVPGGGSTGISRKLPDTERKRLKEILREVVPEDAGVIIRTASEGVSAEELGRDVERLQSQWRKISTAAEDKSAKAPQTLYEEPDLLVKVVRDLFNEDFSKLVIEGEKSWNTVHNYINTVAPDLLPRLERHDNSNVDVFETHRIDEQLAKALDRKVWLPSGGTLVIDRTEAMTVVDVNTGKFTGSGGNLEETVTRNNLEAAEEIVRQMRLRDIGGIIVVDFIDMVLESNRDLVLRRLTEALARDRTRHQVSEVTSLGLVQMTRKKLGTGLVEAFSTTCETCHGRGIVVHSYPVEQTTSDEAPARRPEGGSSRKRRGRDKAAPQPEPAPQNGHDAEVEASIKRAHPVALAMASHHPDDVKVDVESGESVPVEAAPASDSDAAPEITAPETEAPETVAVETAEPAETPEAVTPEPAPSEADPEPRKRRFSLRRRVSRAASAPASEGAGEVFVISAQEASKPVPALIDPTEVVPPRTPRRRRAAGRPAGPPVE